jgi:hypothetical protein
VEGKKIIVLITQVSKDTIQKHVSELGAACAAYHVIVALLDQENPN